MINNVPELVQMLQENKVVIYGAGYVAVRFFQALKKYNLQGNVLNFVTTTGSDEEVEGFKVKNIHAMSELKDVPVCIAVHESIRDEIVEGLKKSGFTKYVWIYPYLNELIFGMSEKIKKISLKELWQANRNNYAIAVRYQAIEQYYGKNRIGYEIYKRILALFHNQGTSEKRLEQFIGLIRNWEENGCDETQSISVLENGIIMDGFHRTALAFYHGKEYMMCNVFPVREMEEGAHDDIAVSTRQSLQERGIETQILRCLEEINRKIEKELKGEL